MLWQSPQHAITMPLLLLSVQAARIAQLQAATVREPECCAPG
jgi:hypothetical protein